MSDVPQSPGIQQQAPTVHATTLGVEAGQDYWLVETADISEVLPLPRLTHVPLTKSWYRGVANIRGKLYSVSDLAGLMGRKQEGAAGAGSVLLVSPRFGCNAGLLVTRVLGLRDATQWQLVQTADGATYRDKEGRVWHRLDIARLLQQPEFLQIEA